MLLLFSGESVILLVKSLASLILSGPLLCGTDRFDVGFLYSCNKKYIAQIDHVDVIKMCDFFSFSFKTITKERFKMCSYEPKWLASGEIIIDLSPCSEQPEPLHLRGRDSREGKPHPNEGFEAEITEGWKNGNVGNLGLLLFKVFYRSWSIPKTSIKSVNHEIL